MAEFNILNVCHEFYGLLSLEAEIVLNGKFEPFRHSHAKWDEDYREYREAFIANLAHHIFDYTVEVCGGEMRHARYHATHYNPDFPTSNMGRHDTFISCRKYSAESVLSASRNLFNAGKWVGGYGGQAWRRIAEAGLMYGQIPDVIFIDHCVDLSHNTSVYFDKAHNEILTLDSANVYKKFLDFKRYQEPRKVIMSVFASKQLASLINRAIALGLIKSPEKCANCEADLDVQYMFEQPFIEWGAKRLPFNLKRTDKEIDNEEDQEDEESQNEDNEEQDPEAYNGFKANYNYQQGIICVKRAS